MPSLPRTRKTNKPKEKKEEPNGAFYRSTLWCGKRRRLHTGKLVYEGGLRSNKIQQDPLDEVYQSVDTPVIGDHVDHIVPIEKGGSATDPRNFMTLTRHMHGTKTNLERHKGILVSVKQGVDGLIPRDRNDIIKILVKYVR